VEEDGVDDGVDEDVAEFTAVVKYLYVRTIEGFLTI
jgi:hypothetical protein